MLAGGEKIGKPNLLRCEFKDSTVIVVSPRLSTVKKMDLIYFLEGLSKIGVDIHQGLV